MENSLIQSVIAFKKKQGCSIPDLELARSFIRNLFEILFICTGEENNKEVVLGSQLQKLERKLQDLFYPVFQDYRRAEVEAATFFGSLPVLFEQCLADAKAIFDADPAAKSMDEILVAYPGFYAIYIYRIAHQLHTQDVGILPRIFSEIAHSQTGIDIHPGAKIGTAFAIDHGTGIVIGETTVIGNSVKIFQGVTLGALSVQKEKASQKRHPTIGDQVVIYSGATILGGDTEIGHHSVIGGNVWITQSVLPFSVVLQQNEISISDKKSFNEPYNFMI
jgi:serine O-acetyltransferase